MDTNTPPISQNPPAKNMFDFKRMKWYEWLAAVPAFILLLQGGAIGGACGFVGWSLCLNVIRKESLSKIVKILMVLGITVLYYILYFIVALILISLIRG